MDTAEERRKLLDDWFLYHRRVYGDGKVHDLHEAGDWADARTERRQRNEANEQLSGAVSYLINLRFDDPAALLPFVLDVSDREEEEGALYSFAAGPLEDLLRHAGPAVIDVIEAKAKESETLRLMLGGVWIDADDMDPDVFRRCVALGCIELGK